MKAVRTYRILFSNVTYYGIENIQHLASKLQHKSPHIDWVVEEREILNLDDKLENQLCLVVPYNQYEAAINAVRLVEGNEPSKFQNDPIHAELQEKLAALSQLCSSPIEDDEEQYLTRFSTLLSEVYALGCKLPKGMNLGLVPEKTEPIDHFLDEWFLEDTFFDEELIFQNYINWILFETSKFTTGDDHFLGAGVVAELYKSFHSEDGWGMRLLETIQLIHQMRGKIILAEEPEVAEVTRKSPNLKSLATEWLKERIDQDQILQQGNLDQSYSFTLIGFAHEPEILVAVNNDGVSFGYDSIRWDGHFPFPIIVTKHTLSWEMLSSLTEEEKETLAIDTFIKTINTRKRQYKTCQFCGEKVPAEHRINSRTCHSCATEHFHVVF
jgi:hypothetical protein